LYKIFIQHFFLDHFTVNGLNIYKKEMDINFLVRENATMGKYAYEPVKKEHIRGPYVKEFFEPKLLTKKLSINELTRFALKEVIRGRKWSEKKSFYVPTFCL
jgi:hypothetical protein